jgi:hypothetical protein
MLATAWMMGKARNIRRCEDLSKSKDMSNGRD